MHFYTKSIFTNPPLGKYFPWAILLMGLWVVGCSPETEQEHGNNMMYDFCNPDRVLELSEKLDEISGLEWYEGQLLSLQDENGIVFFLDPDSGTIEDTLKFDKKGDTEGLCVKDNSIYALQSDGDIFVVEEMNNKRVEKYKTGLDKECEGLCVWSHTNELLIACKDKGKDSDREIYALSVEDLKDGVKPKVKFGINSRELKKVISEKTYDRTEFGSEDAPESIGDRALLNPSGIAEHPLNHSLYILSGTSSLLIVLHPDGNFHTVIPLPDEYLPQPEGIAFSPNGDLFISSEKADKESAHLLKFSYLPE